MTGAILRWWRRMRGRPRPLKPFLRITSPVNDARVRHRITVTGEARGLSGRLVLYVLANDGFWHRQVHTRLDGEVTTWDVRVAVGEDWPDRTWRYTIVALLNPDWQRHPARSATLPEHDFSSEPVYVYRE